MPGTLGSRSADHDGFTLIELLVVVLIVGILAAIAVPTFLSQRAKADDAVAKSAVRAAATAIETYRGDHGTYDTDPAGLRAVEPTLGQAAGLAVGGTADTYTVSVDSLSTPGNTFTISRDGAGTIARTCARPGQGGCPASGRW